jgi:hypothetical protein
MIVSQENWMTMGGGAAALFIPRPAQKPLADQSFSRNGIRYVPVTQPYWLNMSIPFSTPGVTSENATAYTDNQNFPLFVRGAWSNMENDATDVRVRMAVSNTDANWSTNPLLIGAVAGRRELARPLLRYPHGYILPAQSTLRGDFTNSPTNAQDGTSKLVFWCERPETQAIVPVLDARDYWVDVSLNLAGAATATGSAISSQIQHPILIRGAITNAHPLTTIRIFDTQKNIAWSNTKLPIGAFAGIDDGTDVEQYIMYPKPYLLDGNSTLLVEWTNGGGEEVTGRYINFIGERILRQPGKHQIQAPPQIQPGDAPSATPVPPVQPGPVKQPPIQYVPPPPPQAAPPPQAPPAAPPPPGESWYLAGAIVDRQRGIVIETYEDIMSGRRRQQTRMLEPGE